MIIMTLHVTWGHASAHQLKRVWVDPANGNSHPVPYVDEVLRRCGSCRASDKAPRAPIAGAPAAPMFNEKVQADILFSRALIALRSMYMFPKYSLLHPAQSQNPGDEWDALRAGWLGIFGPPKCIRICEGGESKHEIWTDLRAERRIKLQFQGAGAHPWLLERRNGFARMIYNRLIEDDRSPSRWIRVEVQSRVNSMICAGESSAYQMAFGTNAAD